MRENRSGQFGHCERENKKQIVKKIREIKVEGNCEINKPKMKWMEVIRDKMRTCGVDMEIVYLTYYVLNYRGYDLGVRKDGGERLNLVSVE